MIRIRAFVMTTLLVALAVDKRYLICTAIEVQPDPSTASTKLDHLANALRNYEESVAPKPNATLPVVVNVSLYIVSVEQLNVEKLEYSLVVMLRQSWYDSRLEFPNSHNVPIVVKTETHNIWLPDLYFRNGKAGTVHDFPFKNHGAWLYPSGRVVYRQKMSITLTCEMQLWTFPLDKQMCFIIMSSFGYHHHDMELRWDETNDTRGVILDEHLLLSEFAIENISTSYCLASKHYHSDYEDLSCIHVDLLFARRFGFYLVYNYLPSCLIVIVSWTSFWISVNAIPARVSICLLSVVAIMTLSVATVQKLPHVSYIKAIDIWMVGALCFVVLPLFELAVVHCLTRSDNFRSHVCRNKSPGRSYQCSEPSLARRMLESANERRAFRIDFVCIILFPILYAIFCVFYITFLHASDEWFPMNKI